MAFWLAFFFFFFSSRRRHTRYWRDWSSDVCSSDLFPNLASGRRDSEIDTDRHLLELLSESAGEHFGIEMDGGPPSRVRSNLSDGALVVDFFVNLFEVLGMEEDVRAAGRSVPSGDFRDDT